MTDLPSLFVSHGAPTLAIWDSPAHRFLRQLGSSLPLPEAILVVSAHFNAEVPTITGAQTPETIHDFAGFPEALSAITYSAPGAPALAASVAQRLHEAGFAASIDHARGLDHGVWVPLSLMYPKGNVPVVALSVDPGRGPAHHYALGEALAPLRAAGVLIVGSGAITHNLAAFRGHAHDDEPPEWVQSFAQWTAGKVQAGDIADLTDYRKIGPNAQRNHPTPEHILPLFTALGAGGAARERLHSSYTHGVLAMDVYRFEDIKSATEISV